METHRLKQTRQTVVRQDLQAHSDGLKPRLKTTERGRREAVEASPTWHAKADRLREVQGMGDVAILTLIADLPELGQLDRKQIEPPWEFRRLVSVSHTAMADSASRR